MHVSRFAKGEPFSDFQRVGKVDVWYNALIPQSPILFRLKKMNYCFTSGNPTCDWLRLGVHKSTHFSTLSSGNLFHIMLKRAPL